MVMELQELEQPMESLSYDEMRTLKAAEEQNIPEEFTANKTDEDIDYLCDMAKGMWRGATKAAWNTFLFGETIAGQAGSLLSGEGLLNEKEKQQLPLHSFLKPYQKALDEEEGLQTKSFPGSLAEGATQFGVGMATAPTVGGTSKLVTAANTLIKNAFASGVAFDSKDPNALGLLSNFDNKTLKGIGDVFEHSPDEEEWQGRLENIIADSVTFGAGKILGKAAGKGLAKANEAIKETQTFKNVVAAVRNVWYGEEKVKNYDKMMGKIQNIGKKSAIKEAEQAPEEIAKAVSEGKMIEPRDIPSAPVREKIPTNYAEREKQFKEAVKARLGLDPEQITSEQLSKIDEAKIPQDLLDKSIAAKVAQENAGNQFYQVNAELNELLANKKITKHQFRKLYAEAENKYLQTEIDWVNAIDEGGLALGFKSKSEESAALKHYLEWLQANATDVDVEKISALFASVPKEGRATIMRQIVEGGNFKTPVGKKSFNDLFDNVQVVRQAAMLTSVGGWLKDVGYTGLSALWRIPETFVATGISKAQKLKFDVADSAGKKAWNWVAERVFGRGDFTHPMEWREAWDLFAGYAKGLGEVIPYVKEQIDTPLLNKIKQALPDNVSVYNQGRVSGTLSIDPKLPHAKEINGALALLGKGTQAVFNLREASDNIMQSIVARGVLEQRIRSFMAKESTKLLSKAEREKQFVQLINQAIDEMPNYMKRQASFGNEVGEQMFSIGKYAVNESTETVFRDPLQGTTKKAYDLLNSNYLRWVTRTVMPFIKTRMSVYIDSVARQRTPLGFMSKRIKEQVAMGGRSAAMAKARIYTGIAVGGLFAYKYLVDNKISGGFKFIGTPISGPYSSKRPERIAQQAADFVPFSIKIGDKSVPLSSFGVIGDTVAKFLGVTHIMASMYDTLKEHPYYNEEGNLITPEMEFQDVALAFGLAMTNRGVDGSPMGDAMNLINMVSETGVSSKQLKSTAANLVLPTPPVFGEVANIANSTGIDFFSYRDFQQLADTTMNRFLDRIGLPTETKYNFLGGKMKDWNTFANVLGVVTKDKPDENSPEFKVLSEMQLQKAYVSGPTNSIKFSPGNSRIGISTNIYLTDSQVNRLNKMMGEDIKDNGKIYKGINDMMLRMFDSPEYKAAPSETRELPKKIDVTDRAFERALAEKINSRKTKSQMIRDLYNKVLNMKIQELYQEDQDFQQKYRGSVFVDVERVDEFPTVNR